VFCYDVGKTHERGREVNPVMRMVLGRPLVQVVSRTGFLVAALALFLLLGILGPTAGHAEKSGEFALEQNYVHNYETVEHAETVYTGGLIKGMGKVISSSGDPFVEGDSIANRCIVFVEQTEDLSVVNASCIFTDADGDELHLIANRGIGEVGEGEGGAGRWGIEGGTGKYTGITGVCSYRVEYFPNNELTTRSQCMWEK